MTTQLADIPVGAARVKPTREQALAIAERRKAARRARTTRIRRGIAVLSAAAFVAPFGVIYTQLAAGHDPALSNNQAAASVTPASTSNATPAASAVAANAAATSSDSSA